MTQMITREVLCGGVGLPIPQPATQYTPMGGTEEVIVSSLFDLAGLKVILCVQRIVITTRRMVDATPILKNVEDWVGVGTVGSLAIGFANASHCV